MFSMILSAEPINLTAQTPEPIFKTLPTNPIPISSNQSYSIPLEALGMSEQTPKHTVILKKDPLFSEMQRISTRGQFPLKKIRILALWFKIWIKITWITQMRFFSNRFSLKLFWKTIYLSAKTLSQKPRKIINMF